MKNTIYPRWIPLISASILFLLIRISNDVPNEDQYLSHSPLFISIELIGIVFFSYIFLFLNRKLANRVIKQKLSVVFEYLIVLLLPVLVTVAVMWLSHYVEYKSPSISEIIVPGIIVMLMNVWIYSWLKNAVLERHYTDICILNERIRNENLTTKIKLLQAQYRPHFIFNILNTIYFSINEKDETARGAVEHLSNLLRRQLYTCEGKVPLSNEISVVESYIELCRLRFGNSISIFTRFENKQSSIYIYPYILMPLIENAFKYVSGKKIVNIDMRLSEENSLIFCVNNSISDSCKAKVSSGGMGLKNLRQQLMIYYGENGFRLETTKTDLDFTAVLEVYDVI